MQTYAEEAVAAHMANMQEEFFAKSKTTKKCAFRKHYWSRNPAYYEPSNEDFKQMECHESYGKSEDEIIASFKQNKMKIFLKGEIDTVMIQWILFVTNISATGLMAILPNRKHQSLGGWNKL